MIDWPRSRMGCTALILASVFLLVGSAFMIGSAFDSGWTVREPTSAGYGSMVSEKVDFIDYGELSDEQKSEFQTMLNGDTITSDQISLSEDAVMGVSYEGEQYLVQRTATNSIVHWWRLILGGGLAIVSVVSIVYGWNRRININLNKLEEDPVEFVENR